LLGDYHVHVFIFVTIFHFGFAFPALSRFWGFGPEGPAFAWVMLAINSMACSASLSGTIDAISMMAIIQVEGMDRRTL